MSPNQLLQTDQIAADRLVQDTPPANRGRSGIISRMLHGTGAGVVAYGLGIGSNLLLLPLYLRHWSVSTYGEWMALYSVVNYLGSLDFGVSGAAINAATVAYARNDWPTFKRIQGTAWAASIVIAGVGAVVIAILSLFYFHVDHWLGLTVMGRHDARLVFCCLSLSLLASIPGRQLISVFTATGEFAKYQWLYNAFSLFSVLAAAVALSMGSGPVFLAAVTLGTTITTIIYSIWLLNRRGSRLYPQLHDFDWHTARSLASPTGQFGIWMIATALSVQGPIIVLSRALGGPAVALFTTTRTVANVVRGTLTLLRAPLRPEIGAASALPTKGELRRIFRIAVSLDSTIAICLTALLWSGGVWIIRFWSHGNIPPDPMLLHLLLIAFMFEGFLQMLAIAGWSTNRFHAYSMGQLASALFSLILAAIFIDRFGPSAIPLGLIIPSFTIMTPLAIQNAIREAHLSLRFVVGRLLVPFAMLVVFSSIFPASMAKFGFSPGWLGDVISSVTICAIAGLTGAAVFLTREDRRALRNRICA
jgi:O-antigen/teichoic acid export membrane protein